MIQKRVTEALKRRHFWRYATFSEVAELYLSRLLRIFALNMVSLFVAVFLYKQGYSLLFIALYLAIYYGSKVFVAVLAARSAAHFGPKHTILFANIIYIPALIVLSFVPEAGSQYALLMIALFGTLQAFGATFYDYAYLVTFSKVKSVKHAGKELGYMHIIEKVAGIISPIVGGVLASLYSPIVVMSVAACLFAVAALPLLRTGEPTRLRQKISFSGFPWRTTWRSIVAEASVGFDVATTGVVWSLFLLTMVFTAQQDSIYSIIGLLGAIGMGMAFVSAFVFGKIIDRKQGNTLLRLGVVGKSLSHLLRPFTGGMGTAAAVNMGSEVSTTAYAMAFTRGIFDVADYSGHRLAYFMLIEISINLGAALAMGLVSLLLWLFEARDAFTLFFIVAAAVVLLIATPRFALYKRA